MDLQAAREIVATLARGIHPVTGEAFAPDSPYNEPPVIGALLALGEALDAVPAPRPRREPPPNTGKPWLAEHDEALRNGFAAGTSTRELAAALGRTRWAIESRLVKLGVMTLGNAPAAAH